MKKKLLLILILLTLLITAPVLAASSATITVVNTGAAVQMLPITQTMNNSALASGGFIIPSGLDVLVSGASPVPHMLVSDRTMFASPIGASSTTPFYYTTGNSGLLTNYIIPGYGGKVTTSEVAALRLGGKFSIEQKGWVDTTAGADKDLVLKAGSFRTYVSAASTITSTFTGGVLTEQLAPNGAGSETNIPGLVGAATHWQANLTDDGNTSYVHHFNNNYLRDLYATTNSSVGTGGIITNVTIYAVAAKNGVGVEKVKTALKTNGVSYDGAENVLGYVYTTYSQSYNLNPQTSATWTWAEVDAMEIGVSLIGDGSDEAKCTQTYAVVSYYYQPTVSITPVPSADYTVKSYCDGTWFMLSLDGDTSWDGIRSNRVASGGASVAITGGVWTISQNNVMPYMNYYKHSVDVGAGLVLIAHYQPNAIILGVTLPDLALPGAQDGTFVFGANPSGVTTSLSALLSIGQVVSGGADAGSPSLVPKVNPKTAVTTGNPGVAFPLYGLFKGLMDDYNAAAGTTITMEYFWRLVATILAFMFGTGVLIATRQPIFGLLAYFIGFLAPTLWMGGIFDWWVPVFYIVGAVALTMLVTKWSSSSIG